MESQGSQPLPLNYVTWPCRFSQQTDVLPIYFTEVYFLFYLFNYSQVSVQLTPVFAVTLLRDFRLSSSLACPCTSWVSNRLPAAPFVILYTGCPRRNVPDFGRAFLMLKYTDITQNTYIQSWTVTEIMAREKWGFLAVPNTATCTADTSRDNTSGLERGMQCSLCLPDALRSQPCYFTAGLSHV